jgi:hypothetical protein
MVRVYEAKMMHQFDHRFGTYAGQTKAQANQGKLPELDDDDHADPSLLSLPLHWVEAQQFEDLISQYPQRNWLFAYRDITSAVVLRTTIASIIPRTAAVDPCRIIYFSEAVTAGQVSCFLAMFNSLVFDYCARQKVSGNHLAIFILSQLPVIPLSQFDERDREFIVPRVIELVYTAWDLQAFALDVLTEVGAETWNQWFPANPATLSAEGHVTVKPFAWDSSRRAYLRADLDAWYARKFGLNRKQLRFILEPADLTTRELENILNSFEEVNDPLEETAYHQRCSNNEFPSETFRVLKEREIRQFGEYRTRNLTLQAWHRLNTFSQ